MLSYLRLPSVRTCLIENPEFSCSLKDSLEPEGDTAGLGVSLPASQRLRDFPLTIVYKVFTAFLIASALAGIAGFVRLVCEGISYIRNTNLGDTQIVTSIALLITTNFMVGCKISAYHYGLVCKLVIVSSAGHVASIASIRKYFGKSLVMGLIRSLLIIISPGLGWSLFGPIYSSDIFPTAPPKDSTKNMNNTINTGLVLPASCFIDHPGQNGTKSHGNFTASQYWNVNLTATAAVAANSSMRSGGTNSTMVMPKFQHFSSNDGLSHTDIYIYIAITIAIVLAIGASLVLHFYKDENTQNTQNTQNIPHYIAYGMRCVSFLIVYVAMIYGAAKFASLQNWMTSSNWFGDDDGESSWDSFGQFMPMVLLLLPCFSSIGRILY
ncbi:hypothetical protein DM02DRAFT_651497 [Periconia macrospinosa]|uniref:Uncharacterized protein n=1 Tax=Periconia macrospinosa TaxID=97972 RepID=A0A2V1E326_9PLEO|nr:hypothetical protein DM02DRAFT_651497 [Periconia macrospinosa]